MARRRTLHLPVLLAAAMLLACAAAVLVVSEKAEATFPGKNGRIAYSAFDKIYTLNPNGGDKTKVTEGFEPSYSPDGKKIAYTCFFGDPQADEDWEICTIKARGGKPFQVTNNDRLDFSPSYSPSGKKIAYSGSDGQDFEIYTINARGRAKFNVTKNTYDDFYPDYSPDGKKIAYSAREELDGEKEDDEIYTIRATGGKPFQVTNNGLEKDDYDPSYSPNGKKIAYVGYDDRTEETGLYTIRANGGEPLQITNGRDPSWGSRP
jgi:TolB protein